SLQDRRGMQNDVRPLKWLTPDLIQLLNGSLNPAIANDPMFTQTAKRQFSYAAYLKYPKQFSLDLSAQMTKILNRMEPFQDYRGLSGIATSATAQLLAGSNIVDDGFTPMTLVRAVVASNWSDQDKSNLLEAVFLKPLMSKQNEKEPEND